MTIPPANRIVVIGNGMAGHRLLSELVARGQHEGLTAIGAEPHAAYNRILLSSVLAGDKSTADVALAGQAWYASCGIELLTGDAVAKIDRAARTVATASGRVVPYDRLVLATGSRPIRLGLPGIDLAGVTAFRDIADVERMCGTPAGARAVVIGGGLLGLEAAAGLQRRGIGVVVVHLAGELMERQLDVPAAALLADAVSTRGIDVRLGAQTKEIVGRDGRVVAVRLADGSELPADLVVLAVGVTPETALAREAGLECGRGIKVDDALCTSDPAISALGECVEHRGQTFGLVGPIWEQAKVLADVLAGRGARYAGTAPVTSLKVSGIDLFSAGVVREGEGAETLVLADPVTPVYRKFVLRDGRLEGALLYGDVEDAGWYAELIAGAQDVGTLRDALAFGRAHAQPMAQAAE
ncbi:MAG: NAD(P)/FAD-dependent oxidoreductase [Rhodospirillales bacterium]|nr:NAD(P)/FAD-dependent oxidoreductase [Rhodospirillales bacterium]